MLRYYNILIKTDLDINITGAIINIISEKNAPFIYNKG